MDGKLIALTLVLVIVAVLCAWIVSTAFTGTSDVGATGAKTSTTDLYISMNIKEQAKPVEVPLMISMSIIEPEGLRGE